MANVSQTALAARDGRLDSTLWPVTCLFVCFTDIDRCVIDIASSSAAVAPKS